MSSLDGYIRVWDFLDGVLLQTIDVSHPVAHVCAHASAKDSVYVAVARPTKKKSSKGKDIEDNGAVLHVSLRPSSETASLPIQKPAFIVGIGKTRSCNGLDVSPDGAWLVAIAGNKVYVAKTSALKAGFTKYVSPERLSSLTFHPENEYFATGDDKGVVRLWYCLNDQVPEKAVGVEKKAQTTALHWHSHAVSSLSFTANGAYLLSGGEESVLVIWQLHTGKKEFVPRLGSPITSVSVSPQTGAEEYLVGLADATFTFINATNLRVSRSYARIRLGTYSIDTFHGMILTATHRSDDWPNQSAKLCTTCCAQNIGHSCPAIITPFISPNIRPRDSKADIGGRGIAL